MDIGGGGEILAPLIQLWGGPRPPLPPPPPPVPTVLYCIYIQNTTNNSYIYRSYK